MSLPRQPAPNPVSPAPDHLDALAVAAALGSDAARFRLDLRDACESTNSLLLAQAEAGAPDRSVLVCARQSAGRGRRGRSWLSCGDDGLTFSLLCRPTASDFRAGGLSLAVGVSLARALEALGAQGVTLKWPNDLLLDGRKLAGVLIELVPNDAGPAAFIVGIGINLRLPADFPDTIAAAALAAALPQPPPRSALLAGLLLALDGAARVFERAGFAAFRESWLARCAHLDAQVAILGDRENLQGICRGVDEDGALLLETAAGVQRIVSGDVSLRPC